MSRLQLLVVALAAVSCGPTSKNPMQEERRREQLVAAPTTDAAVPATDAGAGIAVVDGIEPDPCSGSWIDLDQIVRDKTCDVSLESRTRNRASPSELSISSEIPELRISPGAAADISITFRNVSGSSLSIDFPHCGMELFHWAVIDVQGQRADFFDNPDEECVPGGCFGNVERLTLEPDGAATATIPYVARMRDCQDYAWSALLVGTYTLQVYLPIDDPTLGTPRKLLIPLIVADE